MGRKSLGFPSQKEYKRWYYNTKGKFRTTKRNPQNPEYAKNYRERIQSKGFFVYAYFDLSTNGQALYVGKGRYYRPKAHKHKSWYRPDLLLITMTCKNEWEAMEYEGKWGGTYLPLYNADGNRS